MEPITIVGVLFSTFALTRAVLRYRDGQIPVTVFSFWILFWVVVVTFTSHIPLARQVSEFIGIERPVDLFVYLGILLLFYLHFRLYVRMQDQDHEITKLVQELALRKPQK